VHPDDRLNEGQSKSVSARCASFDPSLEKAPADFQIEAGAVIFHRQCAHVVGRVQ
jgi:hypothetical protein